MPRPFIGVEKMQSVSVGISGRHAPSRSAPTEPPCRGCRRQHKGGDGVLGVLTRERPPADADGGTSAAASSSQHRPSLALSGQPILDPNGSVTDDLALEASVEARELRLVEVVRHCFQTRCDARGTE